jgi:hypothetical protein
MIGLVMAVERFEVRADYALASFHATNWRYASRKLNREVRGAKVLCFGDSLVKHGVHPRVLEQTAGVKAYSLALNNGAVPASYFLFRRALERGTKPSVILIDAAEKVLSEGPRSPKRSYPWADLLSLRETAELSWAARDPDLFVRVHLDKALHSFKNRFVIRESIAKALLGEETWLRTYLPGFVRNWNLNAGAQTNPKGNYKEGTYPPEDRQLPGTWECDPVNREFLERTFNLAARHGVAVFWLLPPYHPIAQACSRYTGEASRFLEFVREVQTRHPDVIVVDGRYSGYDRFVFFDEAHLDRDGSAAYSATLAGCVSRYLADPAAFPHWLKLPDYRPTSPDPPFEDFWQSHAVVQAATKALRR